MMRPFIAGPLSVALGSPSSRRRSRRSAASWRIPDQPDYGNRHCLETPTSRGEIAESVMPSGGDVKRVVGPQLPAGHDLDAVLPELGAHRELHGLGEASQQSVQAA